MKNAIIIDGTVYELVPNDTGKDVCDTCDLHGMCMSLSYCLCYQIHDPHVNYHYIKWQKGGEP